MARSPSVILLVAWLLLPAMIPAGMVTPAKAQSGFDPAIEEKSCEIGSPLSCQVMGSAYARGDGVPKDSAKAAAYFRRACEGGNMQGCRGLGILYAVGEGVGQDFAQAEALFRQACSGGDAESCKLAEMAKSDRELAESQQGAPGPQPQQSAPASPPSPVAVAGGDGDVFGQCITLDPGVRSGIQVIWHLRNNCSVAIKVAHCNRATFEAAGDPNLCSRLEYRTDTIRAGGTFEFPFTPISDGTGMTDGRVVRNNQFSVLGFACANGSAPTVGFDGGFRFYHC